MEKIKKVLGFDKMESWEAVGWKGGITLLWNDCLRWEVIFKSKWILGVKIPLSGDGHWTL